MSCFNYSPAALMGYRRCEILYGPRSEKTYLLRVANNKSADQPSHTCSLISAFVIRPLESIISRIASSEISTLQLVYVAEETGLNLALWETQKTGFLVVRPI